MNLNIPVILGTAREGRQSEKCALFILDEARKYGFASDLIDVRDYLVSPLKISNADKTPDDPLFQAFARKMAAADGLIVVTPEYNHGYPGELKILLDTSYDEYARKPVGFCGVSGGMLGGARAVEKLRLVAVELHLVNIREAVHFAGVYGLFDEKGELRQREEFAKRARTMFDELSWYARALKKAREEG
jgi:NAD(P)H-dependent FMN reductase